MGNPNVGEVSFEASGKVYLFKLGTYAQAVLERRTKQPASKFFQRKEDEWGVDDVLSVFYAGLFQKQKLTEEQVADLIDDLGIARVSEIIGEALTAAKPVQKPEASGAPAADPQTAEASGTGTDS